MVVTAYFYQKCLADLFGGVTEAEATTYYGIDLLTNTINVLMMNTYTPNRATHQFVSDVTGAGTESSGTGYSRKTLATKTLALATNVLKFDAADVAWATSTFTAQYAVIYKYTDATDAHCPVIGYIDNGSALTTSNGTFTLAFSATGIATITM